MAVRERVGAAGLTAMLREPDVPMWLELVRGDQAEKFAALMAELSRGFDPAGNGKRISAAYGYLGVESASAYLSACHDPMYPPVDVETFWRRWHAVRPGLPVQPRHYVSLGPGDGRKDGVLLDDLRATYLPVDASPELSRLAIRDLVTRHRVPPDWILSLPWDFTLRANLVALRRVLDERFAGRPVLFSLLGNTLAQMDRDAGLLADVADLLLRADDRLLLEVAYAELPPPSPAFVDFHTSALRHYTDLRVDKDSVEHVCYVEGSRSRLVRTVYRNRTDTDIPVTLPNRAVVRFAANDTIRLALNRSYSDAGLAGMVADAGLTVAAEHRAYGHALMVLAPRALGGRS